MAAFTFLGMKHGIDNGNIVSKPNKTLALNLTKDQIVQKINNFYNTDDFNYELVNGYAYDTTIEWLRKDNEILTSKIDINSKVLTGRNSIKNIFDIFDDVYELTRRNKLWYSYNKRC